MLRGRFTLALAFIVQAVIAALDSNGADSSAADSDSDSDSAAAASDSAAFTPGPPSLSIAHLPEFEARYDRYLAVEDSCRRAGADSVLVLEARALSSEADLAAGADEIEPAMALLDEAIALLDSASARPHDGWDQPTNGGFGQPVRIGPR